MGAPNPTGKGGWKKGQSGNPLGRSSSTEEFLKLVREAAPKAFERMQQIALDVNHQDNFKAIQWIVERAHGKPNQSVELTGAEGGDLIPTITINIRKPDVVIDTTGKKKIE